MTSELSKEVPYFNAPEYENLILSLLHGTCIFIGAGVSKLAGYKLWAELRNAMIDYFWSKRDGLSFQNRSIFDYSMCESLKNHKDIIETFDYLYSADKNLFNAGIKETFYSDEKVVTNKIYEPLNKLNNNKNFFVTTNIDRGLQKYLGLPDESISINPIFENPPKLITYLHGRIDREDTWIFTTAQYSKGYSGENAPCMNYIKNIFDNFNVLFIGYGLREPEITQAISLTNKRKTHYWLEGSRRNTEDYLKIRSTTLKENFNIKLIPYCIDDKGDELLCDVIDSLYKTISKNGET
ncbi:MAG: SIR2 family protein [Nitrospirota bacterium]